MSAAYEEAAFLQQLDLRAGQTNSVMLRAMTLRVRIKTVPDFQVVLGGVPQTRRARHGRFRQRIFAEPTVMYAEIRILTMIALPQNHDMIAQSIIDPSAGAPMSMKAVPARAPTHGGNAMPIPDGACDFYYGPNCGSWWTDVSGESPCRSVDTLCIEIKIFFFFRLRKKRHVQRLAALLASDCCALRKGAVIEHGTGLYRFLTA